MIIHIDLTKALANEAGFKELNLDLPDQVNLKLDELLAELIKKSPKMKDLLYESDGTINYHIMIFVNDKPLLSSDEDTMVIRDGDTVHIYPIIGGG